MAGSAKLMKTVINRLECGKEEDENFLGSRLNSVC